MNREPTANPGRLPRTNYFDNKKNKKEHDPDAMDIDRLSPEKWATLMKKGACFICEEPGHMAKDPPKVSHPVTFRHVPNILALSAKSRDFTIQE